MNVALAVADSLLRGVGQVMFQNNPVTGLLFLVGIFINAYENGLSALLGLVVATLAAYLLGADGTLIRNGLFGFNGVLIGIALSVFLQWDWHVAIYIILGAIVSTIVMMALAKLLIGRDMAPLTAPFVLTAWLLLFALYQFGQLHPTKLIGPMPVQPGAAIQTSLREATSGAGAVGLTAANLANALFRGIGEVFLQDNLWTGVVFAIAILINSRVCFGFALLGSALGGLTALVLGGDGVTVYHGLYGFNAVLTGIALGGLFLALSWRSALYALLGVIFSAIVFAAIAVALSPIGIPALTAPFVLTTWVFLLPTGGFRALQRVAVAECASTHSLIRLHAPQLTRAE
ncbi:MAG TPA: urea transporter [Vicinamibacterales bacterium]|nr:urea transporter [Vicinamibacterales bacterium]